MRVYIDGENCRKGLSRVLLQESEITNARQMVNYRLRELLQEILGVSDVEIYYYASEIRLPNGYQPSEDVMNHVERIRAYSRRWVPSLRQQEIKYIKAGYLKPKSKECQNCHERHEALQEKGVDVRLASDMLEDVYNGSENEIILLSSDTDLCPVLHKVKRHGGHVTYIAFSDAINRAVSAVADQTLTISSQKAVQFYRNT